LAPLLPVAALEVPLLAAAVVDEAAAGILVAVLSPQALNKARATIAPPKINNHLRGWRLTEIIYFFAPFDTYISPVKPASIL
jgi:hypothetical protein